MRLNTEQGANWKETPAAALRRPRVRTPSFFIPSEASGLSQALIFSKCSHRFVSDQGTGRFHVFTGGGGGK